MSAVAVRDHNHAVSRIRLLALALNAWHDHLPMPASRVKGEPGTEKTPFGNRQTVRDRDRLLLRLGSPDREEALLGLPDDSNVIGLDQWQKSHAGTFWREIDKAMGLLAQYDPRGHRVLVETLVVPQVGGDHRAVRAKCQALGYVTGGVDHAVETPRAALCAALVALDKLLPIVAFPSELYEQEAAYEDWLGATKPRTTLSGKKSRADIDVNARRERDRYVRELSVLAGLDQQTIALRLGLDQSTVSRILAKEGT